MKRFSALLVIAFAALCGPLGAQDPAPVAVLKLIAPTVVNVGDLATVKVDGTSNAQDVQFMLVPTPANPENVHVFADGIDFVCGADEPSGGVFTVVAAGNLNGKTITATAVVTFGKKPVPPTPTPPTPPTPTPVASHLWLILVYDTTNPAPTTSALVSDSAFWYSLAKEGHQNAVLDASGAAAKPYADQAAKLNVVAPFVLYMDADTKKVLAAEPMPTDKAAVEAEVNALTGKTDKET